MEEKPVNHVYDVDVISFDIAQKDSYELDLKGKFEVIFREGKYYVERIKPKYPKTYKECCDVLGLNTMDNDASGYRADLIISFQELLIARDAYWKIAGEQMSFGKPWEPDWRNSKQDKWALYIHNNAICSNRYVFGHDILAFPTKEMRDAFYENFKDLIELCKELL